MNNGQPMWSSTEHLLADLWTLQVRTNSERGSLSEDFDHPVRAAVSAKAKAEAKKNVRARFLARKYEYKGGE